MKKNPLSSCAKSELLEPNHSNFILVDNSQLNVYGGEIPFRARLESEISKGTSKENAIPIVLVVIEGGPNTAKTVLESLENRTPCVVIDVN